MTSAGAASRPQRERISADVRLKSAGCESTGAGSLFFSGPSFVASSISPSATIWVSTGWCDSAGAQYGTTVSGIGHRLPGRDIYSPGTGSARQGAGVSGPACREEDRGRNAEKRAGAGMPSRGQGPACRAEDRGRHAEPFASGLPPAAPRNACKHDIIGGAGSACQRHGHSAGAI